MLKKNHIYRLSRDCIPLNSQDVPIDLKGCAIKKNTLVKIVDINSKEKSVIAEPLEGSHRYKDYELPISSFKLKDTTILIDLVQYILIPLSIFLIAASFVNIFIAWHAYLNFSDQEARSLFSYYILLRPFILIILGTGLAVGARILDNYKKTTL